MVGSVKIEINGNCLLVSKRNTAEVFAICINELTPSCIRAPPEAATQMNGQLLSTAALTPRTKRSPTTEPIEPPIKRNSKAAITTIC